MTDTIYDLLPHLTVLGLLDADNYTPILFLLFILARPLGGKDGFWFTLGVIVTQFAGAVFFAYVISKFADANSPLLHWLAVYGQIGLGAVLLFVGAFWRPQFRNSHNHDLLSSLGHRPFVWFSIGVVVEITKLMTAVVYFDAVRRILDVSSRISDHLLLLGYFNLIAFAPMILIWLIYLAIGAGSPEKLKSMRGWLVRHEPVLIRFALIAVGLFLIFNGCSFANMSR